MRNENENLDNVRKIPMHTLEGIEPVQPDTPDPEWSKRKKKLIIRLVILGVLFVVLPILSIILLAGIFLLIVKITELAGASDMIYISSKAATFLVTLVSSVTGIVVFIFIFKTIREMIRENYRYGAVLIQNCPACGARIPEGVENCPKCGEKLIYGPGDEE